MDDSDQSLVEAARGGDRKALVTLLERHHPRILRFSMKMCGHPEDAQDVVQDTLLTVAKDFRDFRGASSLSTWLYTIARSYCIKKRRKSKFAPPEEASLEGDSSGEAQDVPHPAPGPEEATVRREVTEALDRAIAHLRPAYRDVLLLRDVEGLSAAEVGEVLGLSVPAVKSRLHRARSEVRARLAPLLGLGEGRALAAPGTRCPDVVKLLSRHLEGDIKPELCARMEKHLESCEACRGACDSLRETLALCRALPTPQVPPKLQAAIRLALEALAGSPP
jgi:RNA polymerase sigma-70 factor (ECF subfamily)